jgi:small multidrug resistance family-3 protein
MIRSIALFVLAGIAEIGGGYLIWLWLRFSRPWWFGLFGALILMLYGVIPTLQPASFDFGRTYAAYGGMFIVLALLWSWFLDARPPDTPSLIGAGLALIGAAIIVYYPRA